MISLYRYRTYIVRNAIADLRHRYTGTGLGVFWNVIAPLMNIAIYAVVFSQLMKARMPENSSKFAFVIYLCSGMLPWTAFSECVTRGMTSFLENATYLKKLPIPEQVFVARTAMAATLSLSINLALLLLFACLTERPNWYWLLVPLICVLWQAMGFGLGLLLGTVNVFIRDVGPMIIVLFQVWMWTLPIIYLDNILPHAVQRIVLFNPPYPYLRAIHDTLVFGKLPALWVWPAMLAWTLGSIAVGWAALHKLRTEIRDVL